MHVDYKVAKIWNYQKKWKFALLCTIIILYYHWILLCYKCEIKLTEKMFFISLRPFIPLETVSGYDLLLGIQNTKQGLDEITNHSTPAAPSPDTSWNDPSLCNPNCTPKSTTPSASLLNSNRFWTILLQQCGQNVNTFGNMISFI